MIKITGSNYIAGDESRKGKTSYTSVNPATNEQSLVSFYCATEEEITYVGEQSFVGFEKMQQLSSKDIACFLRNVSCQITNLGDQLIDSCSWETALPKIRLMNERNRTCNQIELIASYIEQGEHCEVVIYPGNEHGVMLINPEIEPNALELIIEFLAKTLGT